MVVIGVRKTSFPDKNDPNKKVQGMYMFCGHPIGSDGEGVSFYKDDMYYVSSWIVENRLGGRVPRVGDQVEVRYNRNGKLADVIFLDEVEEVGA